MRAYTTLLLTLCATSALWGVDLRRAVMINLGYEVGQLRAAPVSLGKGQPRAWVLAHAEDFDVDPWQEMFFYPAGTLKIGVANEKGDVIWSRDLGRGVVPGVWFTPVFPFDLDKDGVDEIYFVNNVDPVHPLSLRGLRLEALDARTGETRGQWAWPEPAPNQTISHTYRNFIAGGVVKGEPVLVTAQGTYGEMRLQGWTSGMKPRWTLTIPAGPGPRGSHMTPIVDFDNDGVQELMWGERRISLDTGKQLSCGDCDSYNGHSDVIQPFTAEARADSRAWHVFTCRESDPSTSPRVATFDAQGRRVWGALDKGHIDMGWIARLSSMGNPTAMAIRIQAKTLGPDGRFHEGVEEFAWDAVTGEEKKLPFSTYRTVPVDLNGDGVHELIRGLPGGNGEILNAKGQAVAKVEGTLAMASKLLNVPGEQVMMYQTNGIVYIYADDNARDTVRGRERYAHPLYKANQRVTAVGYNLINLGGL